MQDRGGGGGGGRQAFGSLCPNRVQDLAERLARKPGRVEKKVPRKIHPRSNPPALYHDPTPDPVDIAFATIDWQDLGDRSSVFRQEPSRVPAPTQQVTDSHISSAQSLPDIIAQTPPPLL